MTVQTANQGMFKVRLQALNSAQNAIKPFWRICTGALFLILQSPQLLADEMVSAKRYTEINLASDFDMQVLQFPAGTERLLIWVPSKYGIRAGNIPFAKAIQTEGIDYWLVDLHESYLVPTGRQAYAQFKPQHIKELIDHAVEQGWQRIVLGGESRGAALAMQAARQWQLENPGETALKGLLFYHPYLIDGYTPIGEQAVFRPIARATNLPVYIFQPPTQYQALTQCGIGRTTADGRCTCLSSPPGGGQRRLSCTPRRPLESSRNRRAQPCRSTH